ncbi:zinc finger CCCH domain-containing protein 14 isoform X2 [Planococcus citri]|uniref:zinc finger CCCH domain-containing protein 14 isoform X2 n=1 Tax=Planococcus citri TaxID=170843 RepID=UPI0031F7C030
MEGIAAEVGQKLKSAIKAKLMELGAYVDEELPNYVMVMVTNRRSKAEMDRELNLFLGGNTPTFTTWLQSVWTKLEQVTVANLVEKKKPLEKKKKIKKSIKSSSESDDDRKHKKKRKSSASTDVSAKESKKRKSIKTENIEAEVDNISKESSEDGGKRTRDASKTDAPRSNPAADLDSENDMDDTNTETKKSSQEPSILDEDDFLNIKEDFESGFLSDEEIESKAKQKQSTDSKKPSKPIDKVNVSISNKKHSPPEKSIKDDSDKTATDKFKNKENKNVANTISNSKESESHPTKPPTKTILIRNRKVVRSRSRSRSLTRPSASPEENPSRHKSKSISPAPTPPRSPPITSNIIKIREKSPVLDARELINRKRALLHAAERSSKDDKIPQKRALLAAKHNNDAIHLQDATEKENDSRRVHPENITDMKAERQVENKFGRVILNKLEGKRSVISEERFSSVSRAKNDTIDLRKIKRTVYVRSEDSEPEEPDEKSKIRKSVVNQIVKYIKDEPVASSNTTAAAAKATKLNRSKVTATARSVGSTLIRKAMADAHRSLTTKEEAVKKKEAHDSKYKTSTNLKKEEMKNASKEHLESMLTEDDSNDVEVISPDTLTPIDQDDDESVSPKVEDESEESRLNEVPVEVEEYDPSQTMPTFVVTLTGLDPKLYPEDNMELNESSEVESGQNDQQEFYSDFEESKVKAKLPEQCKYYPNCLAGDQCLYHHPTIPCKMFPNCKFGNSCLYMHPKCKFDAACTRYDCPYLHTAIRMTVPVSGRHAAPPSTIGAQPCKFYYNCVNPVCPFQHPKICRYDRHCMNKNCTYQHTSLIHVNNSFSKDKLRWSKPKNEGEETKASEMNAIDT